MVSEQQAIIKPDPDPTTLTTQALQREVLSVREIIEARLDGMDKAISLIQDAVDRSPTIAESNAKFKEKFKSIDIQFTERDRRFDLAAKDQKIAVDAALQAAKELGDEQNKSNKLAIDKSETAFTKQIDQITKSIDTLGKTLNDKIDDNKSRLNYVENNDKGRVEHSKGVGDGYGYIVGIIGFISSMVAIFYMIFKIAVNK